MTCVCAVLLSMLLGDTVFSELSHDEARRYAQTTGRTLVLYFASDLDADSRHMEQTSWRSPLVVDWVRQHGLVLRIDAEQHPELADLYAVKRIPALLWFDHGEERKRRRHGDVPPSVLISWLHTPYGKLQSLEDLQGIFDDPLAHPLTRISARELIADRSEPEQALEHYLWLWMEADTLSPAWAYSRRTFFARSMGKFAHRYPPAEVAFGELFESARTSVLAGSQHEGAWLDWLALGKHLDRDTELIADIQHVLATQGAAAFPGLARSVAWNDCKKQGRSAATGMLMTDVLPDARPLFEIDEAEMKEVYESLFGEAGHKYVGTFEAGFLPAVRESQLPERTRLRAIGSYTPLLVAGRTDEALRVASALLESLDDVESRLALIEATLAADDDWSGASAGTDAFSRLLAEGTRPVFQVQEPLRIWLEEARRLAASVEQRAAADALGRRLKCP